MQYGAIASDEPNVPAYSGRVAKQFGGSSQALKPFVDMGKLHLVKSTTKVTSFQHLTELITNGYPVTVASNQGFNMEADSSGFHSPHGNWGHQMCCLPQTLIRSRLTTNIENVKIGDNVLGHDGKLHQVTQIFTRNVDESITVIKLHGIANTLKLTDNHPVLVLREDNENYQENGYTDGGIATLSKRKTLKWVNANEIIVDDYLVSPCYNNEIIDNKTPEWVNPRNIHEPYKLQIDDDLAWLFGLYVADGNAEPNHKICITLGVHQTDIINKCVKTIQDKLGFNPHVRYYEKFVRIKVFSSVLANSMLQWFGKKQDKHLPEWIFDGWNLKETIQGIFDGDGNYIKSNKNVRRIVNTSRTLIDQIYNILTMHGEKPSVSKHIYKKHPSWNIKYSIDWHINSSKTEFNKWWGNNLLIKVKEVSTEHYTGQVYNLEVEDCHSYVANGVAVHNCIMGVDSKYKTPYATILNSWGDVHGHLKDFDTQEDLPVGVLRVRAETIERMIKQDDTFAYSHADWFEEQKLPIDLFKLI
jgi:intein/homing endonuclease